MHIIRYLAVWLSRPFAAEAITMMQSQLTAPLALPSSEKCLEVLSFDQPRLVRSICYQPSVLNPSDDGPLVALQKFRGFPDGVDSMLFYPSRGK